MSSIEPATSLPPETQEEELSILLNRMYREMEGRPLLDKAESGSFTRTCREDYLVFYTRKGKTGVEEIERDIAECQEAERLYRDLGQGLLAQKARLRAKGGRQAIREMRRERVQSERGSELNPGLKVIAVIPSNESKSGH